MKIFLVGLFGVSFGILEAIVVVYLRNIPAKHGHFFVPLIHEFPNEVLFIEQTREIATIVMLVCFALLIGKSLWEKLAVFLFSFAFWDLTYYAALYKFIKFPPSIFAWDVLFLVPGKWWFPWSGAIVIMICFLTAALWIFRRKVEST